MTANVYLSQEGSNKSLSLKENSPKLAVTLLDYVYKQIHLGLASSVFCASIIFIGIFSSAISHYQLTAWYIFFLSITVIRAVTVIMYKKYNHFNLVIWRRLYIFGALLGGISWGLPGIFFFHYVNPIQQTLMILMLAGVTSGAVALSAGVPKAAIAFLIFSIVPYIISIILLKDMTYLLFDCAMSIYLIYMIILSLKTYQIIKKSILLKFENDELLKNLSNAKNQLEIINKQLEIINKQLEKKATHDPLTQIANRALFKINFEETIRRAGRNNKIVGLLYLDLDKFKVINDQYGHHIGDYVLLIVTKRLTHFLGSTDIISRLGGDEFTIIIENANNTDEILSSAKMICHSIASPIRVNKLDLQIATSIGISIYPDDGTDAETLIRRADKTMYYVKMHGGNSYQLSKELL